MQQKDKTEVLLGLLEMMLTEYKITLLISLFSVQSPLRHTFLHVQRGQKEKSTDQIAFNILFILV